MNNVIKQAKPMGSSVIAALVERNIHDKEVKGSELHVPGGAVLCH